jgi:hypothetical protein
VKIRSSIVALSLASSLMLLPLPINAQYFYCASAVGGGCGTQCTVGGSGSCTWCEEWTDDNENPCFNQVLGCTGSIDPDSGNTGGNHCYWDEDPCC